MSDLILIGIDDTDVLGSSGTGHMARDMVDHLFQLGLGESTGVTRHQLLVDDRIPYTSHNSSLCIGFRSSVPADELQEPCIDFLEANFRDGSDPGLCICSADAVDARVEGFGRDAQTEVLQKQEAIELAHECDVFLVELGGTGGGIIGALAAVGLRAYGQSGRYIDLAGIRAITGIVTVSELLEKTDVVSVQDAESKILGLEERIDSRDWIRPSLVGGLPIVRVRPDKTEAGEPVWRLIEKRQKELRQEKEG